MSNLVASLQGGGDGTGLSAEMFGFQFTLLQSTNVRTPAVYHSTLFDQNLLTLKSLCQNFQSKIFKLKVKDDIGVRAFNWHEKKYANERSSGNNI